MLKAVPTNNILRFAQAGRVALLFVRSEERLVYGEGTHHPPPLLNILLMPGTPEKMIEHPSSEVASNVRLL